MKFEKISDDRLRITLTYDDMEELDFDAIELSYEDSDASDILDELLELAEQECGFETQGYRLVVEVMPFHSEGLMLTITKILKENDLLSKMKDMQETKQHPLLFGFDDFYILISALKELAPFYEGESAVYSYRQNYFLWLLPKHHKDEKRILLILCEFGTYLTKNSYIGMVKEYASVVIENNAVEKALTI